MRKVISIFTSKNNGISDIETLTVMTDDKRFFNQRPFYVSVKSLCRTPFAEHLLDYMSSTEWLLVKDIFIVKKCVHSIPENSTHQFYNLGISYWITSQWLPCFVCIINPRDGESVTMQNGLLLLRLSEWVWGWDPGICIVNRGFWCSEWSLSSQRESLLCRLNYWFLMFGD